MVSAATSASSRSPSPGTHSDLGSNCYAASISSWVTSNPPSTATECNFPEGDLEPSESERVGMGMGNKWNDE